MFKRIINLWLRMFVYNDKALQKLKGTRFDFVFTSNERIIECYIADISNKYGLTCLCYKDDKVSDNSEYINIYAGDKVVCVNLTFDWHKREHMIKYIKAIKTGTLFDIDIAKHPDVNGNLSCAFE